MAKQGETACLDNSRKLWLLGCPPSHVTFQTEQLSKTSLIESINLVYISLGKCPSLRAAQKMGDVSVIQLQVGGDVRFLTSRSHYPVDNCLMFFNDTRTKQKTTNPQKRL